MYDSEDRGEWFRISWLIWPLSKNVMNNNTICNLPLESGQHDETLNSLRHRLNTMKAIFGDVDDNLDPASAAAKKRAARRRQGNCIDTIIDGSFMGVVLALCLCMVLGAAFFAYRNLYYAVIKKMYPEKEEL